MQRSGQKSTPYRIEIYGRQDCTACRTAMEILESGFSSYLSKIEFLDLTTPDALQRWARNGVDIRGIPSIMLIKNDIVIRRFTGINFSEKLKEIFEKNKCK